MAKTIDDPLENPSWVLMAKALHGELTDLERQHFNEWLQANDSHAHQWAKALETWNEVGTEQNASFSPDLDKAWATFCAKTEFTNSFPQTLSSSEKPYELDVQKIYAWNNLFKYAAVLVLAAGLAWLGFLPWGTSASAWTQVATQAGERKLIYLPDSSEVFLNSNSTLRYQTAFEGPERKVELTGEAFFEVRKNLDQPFVVESGEAHTKVLGTSFNVRAVAAEQNVAVTVVTGKVSFTSLQKQKPILLTPGFTGVLTKDGQLAKNVSGPSDASSWKSLSFKEKTLEEIAAQLEAYFNVSIDISGQNLQQCTFTGNFEQPALKDILQVLAASTDSKSSEKGPGKYTLTGNGCQ